MVELLSQPWPWWAAGIIIALPGPTCTFLGYNLFAISSSMRPISEACYAPRIPLIKHDWRQESCNLFFVGGILLGAIIASTLLANPNPVQVAPALAAELQGYGLTDFSNMLPTEIYSWESLFSLRGFILLVVGGFLVGFGTRYAGGCTSGHAIMGLSNLQWPSLVATISFMAGGFLMANLLLPFIMRL